MTDYPFESFEPTPELAEAAEKRINAAHNQIKDADMERLKEVLAHLPLLDAQQHLVSQAAWKICSAFELAKQEIGEESILLFPRTSPEPRKPLATAVTEEAANWFFILTGKTVARVSKQIDRLEGLQETGEFASFLAKVFGIFGIQASAAGQTKTWKNRYPSAETKEWIHPADMATLLSSPEEFQKLLDGLDSSIAHKLSTADESEQS